jgi:hypothetical protein
VFGYPVVFKRNSPQVNRKIQREFKTLQHGQRCIFVGFPNNQAGWLIFVQEKILGSHLIVSMDVVFDQYFMSGITASIQGYTGSQMTKKIGNNSGQKPRIMEETGTITNLTDTQISHANVEESPVYKICKKHNILMSNLVGFSETSWQDCPLFEFC